ncbi:MAG: TonB-dependent receptor [Cytophagaceae bacterium]|nr:TonB-dependent receptor [Cytophagaceae bacterium]
MKPNILFIFFIFLNLVGHAQQPSQTIRGRVLDKDSQQPVPGATILLNGSQKGSFTDENGIFSFEKLPIGRYTLSISMVGYFSQKLPLIDLGSGKEVVLSIELNENAQLLDELVVKAEYDKQKTINDLTMVSGRQFTVQETNRYAGGYSDQSRMAMSFAGVASAGNDQNNEIVIRGNSPKGLLWRLEGVEIPNPNHFGDGQGSTSGIISMLNSNSLANSDFLTGAFPAEYGNASSGVFDLRMRRGNDQKHEFTGQFGIIGLDASAEGPLKKGGPSYRVNMRYSTLELLFKSGLLAIETGDFKPAYRDANFTLNFPTKKAGTFSLFGLGGMSFSDEKDQTSNDSESQKMGVMGLSHKISTGKKGYFYSVLAFSRESSTNLNQDFINNKEWVVSQKNLYAYNTIRLSGFYNYKINQKTSLRSGLIFSNMAYKLDENRRDNSRNLLVNYLKENDVSQFFQVYSQAKYSPGERLSLTAGLHYNKFLLNQNQMLEPRAGVKFQINPKNTLSAGFGLHSRLEPVSMYLYKRRKQGEIFVQPNRNIGLTRAAHYVLGYDRSLNPNTRLKIEAYYQKLFNVPVDTNRKSTFSMLNATSGIPNNVLENSGLGENYGLELTLERYFANNFYYLITASLFDSKFMVKDKIWRNTVFNNTYVGNLLAGRDFAIGKQKIHWFTVNSRLMWRGGNRYTPINLAESIRRNTTIQDANKAFVPRYPDYLRLDMGFSYKLNKKKTTWNFSADIQNITNRKNIIRERYNSTTKSIYYNYALPLIPIISAKVDF